MKSCILLVAAIDGYLCLYVLGVSESWVDGVKIQEKYTFYFTHKWRDVTVLYLTNNIVERRCVLCTFNDNEQML